MELTLIYFNPIGLPEQLLLKLFMRLHMVASYLQLGSPTPSAKSLEMLRFGRESGISSTWAHFLHGFWTTRAASCCDQWRLATSSYACALVLQVQNSNRGWWASKFGLLRGTAFAIVDVDVNKERGLNLSWQKTSYINAEFPHSRPSKAIPGPAGQFTQL